MFSYPVTLTPDKQDGGFVVTFKDIPEAITQGETEQEALEAGLEAIETALDFYFENKRLVPLPSLPKRRQKAVTLSASLTAKVLLLNEMVAQNVRPADLVRR
jgi:antitoxin HicB